MLQIATMSTLWGSKTGGIDVFHRDLVKSLCQRDDTQLTVFLQDSSEALFSDSKEYGFEFFTANECPSDPKKGEYGPWSEQQVKSAFFDVITRPLSGKPKFAPDFIILNDIFCFNALSIIRESFPDCAIITMLHSAYGRSEKRKAAPDQSIHMKLEKQVEMIEKSDFVFSIGSFAVSHFQAHVDQSSKEKIDFILPGRPDVKILTDVPSHLHVTSFGRLDTKSDTIKQISSAAGAWSKAIASKRIDQLEVQDVKFYAFGANGIGGVLDGLKEASHNNWNVGILELPFEEVSAIEESKIYNALKKSAFAILPSWYENFGLTFLETCSLGVPSIISSSSGFYHDLMTYAENTLSDSDLNLVDTLGKSDSEIERQIYDLILTRSSNYEETKRKAIQLAELIEAKWPTWPQVAEQFIQRVRPELSKDSTSRNSEVIDHAPRDLEIKPEGPTLRDLMDWSWQENLEYYKKSDLSKEGLLQKQYSLTRLQKKFWNKREELVSHSLKDIIIAGGTSSGKTTIAETLIGRARPYEFGRSRTLYIAPTKALAQEKAESWRTLFPSPYPHRSTYDTVIVSTGDDNASDGALVRGDFNIASTVYEKANVILTGTVDLFSKLNLVIIDEFHMIEDPHRGAVLESLLAKLNMEKQRRLRQGRDIDPLRIAVVTTESVGEDLKNYFTFRDLTSKLQVPPVVVEDYGRPRAISHQIATPARTDNGSIALFPLKTFGEDDLLVISPEQVEQIRSDWNIFRSSLNHIDEKYSYDSTSKRDADVFELVKQWIDQNPKGKRLLCFTNSKFSAIQLARTIKNSRRETTWENTSDGGQVLQPDKDSMHGIQDAIESAEETALTKSLLECSEKGVFIHNADVPRPIRRSIEEYLGKPIKENASSEVIIATETLSFGVNLKISDVYILSLLFPEGDRIEVGTTAKKPLTRCDFVNMVGRAGRLGQGDADGNVVWFLDEDEEMSLSVALSRFYTEGQPLVSQLFHEADSAAAEKVDDDELLLALGIETRKESGPVNQSFSGTLSTEAENASISDGLLSEAYTNSSAVANYSYPLVRAVLDALRFLGGTDKSLGFTQDNSSDAKELFLNYFKNTFYFHQRCDNRIQGLSDEDKKVARLRAQELFNAVSDTLVSACESRFGLVRSPLPDRYQITPLGMASIDTGTEVGTIAKLRNAVFQIHTLWEAKLATTLPIELVILPLFFQSDVHRRFIKNMPEHNVQGKWIAEANRSNLINRLVQKLIEQSVIREETAPRVSEVIQDFVVWTVGNQTIVGAQGWYDEAPHDACLRLFLAFLSWTNGDSLRLVVKEIQDLYPESGLNAKDVIFNFETFSENFTWKVLFLISLIRASNEKILPKGATFDAVRFVHRSRLGCTESCIPILYRTKTQSAPVNRVVAHNIISQGVTAAELALGRNPRLKIGSKKAARLNSHVQKFIHENFKELARSFHHLASGTGAGALNEEVARDYWNFAEKQVKALVESKVHVRNAWQAADAFDPELLLKSDNTEPPLSLMRLTKLPNGVGFSVFSPGFVDDDDERIVIKKSFEISAIYSFSDEDRSGLTAGNLHAARVIVDFPWAAGDDIGPHDVLRLSPAAFGIVLSLCSRNFITNPSRYLRSLLDTGGNKAIGVKGLYHLSEEHLNERLFPEAIFEAWAKYIEVGG